MRAGIGYALFFLLLFARFPLHGLLPGNTDTLLAVALSNLSLEKVQLLLSGSPTFTALYPAKDVMAYGENCHGLVAIFVFFKLLLRSDLWAYYLFTATLFTLNAFGFYKLAGLFVDRASAFLAGTVFTSMGFLLGNIDDPNVIFLFLPLMALYYLEVACRERNRRLVFLGLALSGLQIWFGFYIFFYQALLLAGFGLARWRVLVPLFAPRDLPRLALAYLIPAAPLLALYLYNHFSANVVSPYDLQITSRHSSLEWHNFRNVLPHNLVYSDRGNVYGVNDSGGWHRPRKNGFPGFAFPICALIGLVASFRRTRFYQAVFVVFFTLSFGVHLPFFDRLFELPLGAYLRIPLRFLLIALIPASLFFAQGLGFLRTWATGRKYRLALLPALLTSALVLTENVPVPLSGFPLAELLVPPASYVNFFAGFSGSRIVLDLPSTCLYRKDMSVNELGLFWFYSRDILYMNWQSYHRQRILGGVNAYVPRSRIELDPEFQEVPNPQAIAKLKAVGVQYIVFHKNLILYPTEDVLGALKNSPMLTQKLEDKDLAIFELKPDGTNRVSMR